jgi:serine O-acetyltransferase
MGDVVVVEGGPESWTELVDLVKSDLFRYTGRVSAKAFLVQAAFTPGFKYTLWMRTCGWLRRGRVTKRVLFPPAKAVLLHYRYKYGIAIPEYTRIGRGFYINRFGGIFVHGDVVIGDNCNLSQGALLAEKNGGARAGTPVLGDRVYLAAHAKVIGGVTVGDDVAVGTDALVTKDVEAGATVVGSPARVLDHTGSANYINRQV